jgi:bisphosphoglycerate-dependent phosphoglycerate mutase
MYMYQEDMSGSSNTVPAAVDEVAYEDAKTPYATLFLIRHGETLLNAAKVLQGSGVDPPLSGVGREQARLVGERFANIHVDNVAASQLLRARETAQYISQHHPNATFQVNEHAV